MIHNKEFPEFGLEQLFTFGKLLFLAKHLKYKYLRLITKLVLAASDKR